MKRIEEYIELANKAVENISYPAEPNGLYEPIRYGMAQGGKRLRPALLLAACDAAGVETEKAMKQAAAIEMFHNFTLLHDDVMDKADLRRGKPTVCNKWDDNTAILSGDTMLTLATELLVDGMEAQKAVRLLRLFNRTAIEVYEGQQYDMEFETRNDVSIDEYIHMIRLKTSVLLGCACKIGAIVGDATENNAKHFTTLPSTWASRSNCRTTYSTYTATQRYSARLSVATSSTIKRHSCSSMRCNLPKATTVPNCNAG